MTTRTAERQKRIAQLETPLVFKAPAIPAVWLAPAPAVVATTAPAAPSTPVVDQDEAYWQFIVQAGAPADEEPPQPPAPADNDRAPMTLQATVDMALAGDRAPAGWPERYAAWWTAHPRPAVGYAAALASLERFIAGTAYGE